MVASVLLALSSTAPAQNSPERNRARAHFKAGTTLYEAGEYDRAIVEYETAYEISALPDLLFNIAQAHRLANRPQQALIYYRRYVAAKPVGSVSDEARQWIAELELRDRPVAPPTAPEPPHAPPPASTPPPATPHVTTSAPSSAINAPAIDVAKAEPQRHHRPLYKSWWLWTAGGVAVVAIATGIAVGLTARHDEPVAATVHFP